MGKEISNNPGNQYQDSGIKDIILFAKFDFYHKENNMGFNKNKMIMLNIEE